MSYENTKKFFDELGKNEALKKSFEVAMDECSEKAEKLFTEKIVGLAKAAGFNFTANDLKELTDGDGELSDNEMKKAGGGYWKVYPPSWYYKEKYGKKQE